MEGQCGVNEVDELVAASGGKLQPCHVVVVSSRHVTITTTSHHRPVVPCLTHRCVATLMTMSGCLQPPAVDSPLGLSASALLERSAAVCDLLNTPSLNILALQETWHESTDSIRRTDRRAAPPGYAVTEEARCSATSKRPSDRVQNYGGVTIVCRSSFKSSKLSSLPQVKTIEYVCCRLHGDTSGDVVVASIHRPGRAVVTQIFSA